MAVGQALQPQRRIEPAPIRRAAPRWRRAARAFRACSRSTRSVRAVESILIRRHRPPRRPARRSRGDGRSACVSLPSARRRATAMRGNGSSRRHARAPRCARRRAVWPSARADWRESRLRPASPAAWSGWQSSARPARARADAAIRRRPCARSARKFLTMRSSSEWNDTTDQPAARLQHALGGGERQMQFVEFVVDEDPQRLERPRRRMDLARLAAHHLGDDIGERPGGGDRRLLARARRWRARRRANAAPRRR